MSSHQTRPTIATTVTGNPDPRRVTRSSDTIPSHLAGASARAEGNTAVSYRSLLASVIDGIHVSFIGVRGHPAPSF
jgi:hypothetical protein